MAFTPSTTNAADGYFVPPEEAPHHSIFLQWPASRKVHSDPVFLDMTQAALFGP